MLSILNFACNSWTVIYLFRSESITCCVVGAIHKTKWGLEVVTQLVSAFIPHRTRSLREQGEGESPRSKSGLWSTTDCRENKWIMLVGRFLVEVEGWHMS